MQPLAAVAGDGFDFSLWDLLGPFVGPCVLALVVLAVVRQLLARLFDRLTDSEPAPGRSEDSGEEASSRPEAR
jgi:hypothetical protein